MQHDKAYSRSALALLGASTLASIALVELLLAPWYVFRGVDRDLGLMGFYAPPGLLVDDTQINPDGFTGHALSQIDDTSDTTRILTLGGSTMFNRRMTE